jgi:hypothetical protein
MSGCDHCGNECSLPFTCQHCGGKFCPECRLPPNHNCAGIGTWKKKPLPAVGMSYGRGGGVTATGGGYGRETVHGKKEKPAREVLWLKIMIGVIAIVFLVIFYLVVSGYTTM